MKAERDPLLWVKLRRKVFLWRCVKGRALNDGASVLRHISNRNGFHSIKIYGTLVLKCMCVYTY